jgi:hypothetical protein
VSDFLLSTRTIKIIIKIQLKTLASLKKEKRNTRRKILSSLEKNENETENGTCASA